MEYIMSLFGNPRYQYRETYFVLFKEENRPSNEILEAAINGLGDRFEIKETHHDSEQNLESMTVIAPADFAGMDLTYVGGEEILEQVAELNEQFKTTTLTGDEMKKIAKINSCRARYDILHFEELTESDDEFLDPGALLTIVETISELCDGVGIDRETLTIV